MNGQSRGFLFEDICFANGYEDYGSYEGAVVEAP